MSLLTHLLTSTYLVHTFLPTYLPTNLHGGGAQHTVLIVPLESEGHLLAVVKFRNGVRVGARVRVRMRVGLRVGVRVWARVRVSGTPARSLGLRVKG